MVAGLALAIIAGLMRTMTALIDVVTVLAFLAAPVIAWLNFAAVRGEAVPAVHRPGRALTALSWAGLAFLGGFGVLWAVVRFG